MKVKIKGIRELVGAKYAFDNSGNLVGVYLEEDIKKGVHNIFPMKLVEDIYDD